MNSYFDSYTNYDHQVDRRNSYSEDGGVRRKQAKFPNRTRGGGRGGVRRSDAVFKEPREPPRRSPVQDRRREPQVNSHHRSPNTGYQRNQSSSQRGGTSSKSYFDMSDMPRFIEPEHTSQDLYWGNFLNGCKNWQEKHKLAYYKSRCLSLEFENQMLYKQIESLIEENVIFANERGEVPAMRLAAMFEKEEKSREQDSDHEPKDSTASNKKRQSEEQQRSADTKKTKMERELQKGEEKKKEEGPTQPHSLQREESLHQLYGKNAAVIQKLETSVQLNFNRNCDTLKPELWMAVPLNSQVIDE